MAVLLSHATVASSDGPAVSTAELAVAAAREAIARVAGDYHPYAVWFSAETDPDPSTTIAAQVHHELGLAGFAGAYDMLGGPRSAVGALKIASTSTMLAVLFDRASDSASAFCFGKGDPLAEEISGANATDIDDPSGRSSAAATIESSLQTAELGIDDVEVFAVAGRDPSALMGAISAGPTRLISGGGVGRVLSDALSVAPFGSIVAQVVGCDGVDVRLWRIGAGATAV